LSGEHPTTKLCLQLLTKLDVKGAHVMDYGAGSGVLAIGGCWA
jgi:ribosomal protein L11 methyltransferase